MALFAAGGAACVAASLLCTCPNGSIEFGIIGIVFFYDIVELGRQQRRVREGRARANPANARHKAIFESGKALTEELFAREPARPAYREAGR